MPLYRFIFLPTGITFQRASADSSEGGTKMPRQATELQETAHRPRTGEDLRNLETHRDHIAALAYLHWHARGCPDDSAEEDWFRAERELEDRREPTLTGA